jgi:hypothetical protein
VLAPRFFSDALSNVKDGPEACLYTLALLAAWRFTESPSNGRAILFGVVAGLALGQKLNASWLIVHAPGTCVRARNVCRRRKSSRRYWITRIAAPTIANE